MRGGWGAVGIVLGFWEAAAFTTGRVPTVSATVARYRCWWVDTVVVLWAVGTLRHLLTYKEEGTVG